MTGQHELNHTCLKLIAAQLLTWCCFAAPLQAQERIEMQGTAIIGNKELPKVLYIVPWKSAERINIEQPAFSSILDRSMRPIERSTFQRQVRYYQELYPQTDNESGQ